MHHAKLIHGDPTNSWLSRMLIPVFVIFPSGVGSTVTVKTGGCRRQFSDRNPGGNDENNVYRCARERARTDDRRAEVSPSVKMRPLRIADSPVSLECRLHATAPLGLNQVILIGRSVHAHVADHFVIDPDEPEFNTPTPRPIGGRHEAKWYTRTGDLFDMERPTWAEWQPRRKVK